MIRVEVVKDETGAAIGFVVNLERMVENRRGLNAALGARLTDELQDHFRARNLEPNKRGWKKSGFWGEIAESTQLEEVTEDGASVVVADHRLGIHVRGGTIQPVNADNLTIPIHPMAKGRYVRTLEREENLDIFTIPRAGGLPTNVLAAIIGGELVALYVLVPDVHIPQDPRALPGDEALMNALAEEAEDYVSREIRRKEARA